MILESEGEQLFFNNNFIPLYKTWQEFIEYLLYTHLWAKPQDAEDRESKEYV